MNTDELLSVLRGSGYGMCVWAANEIASLRAERDALQAKLDAANALLERAHDVAMVKVIWSRQDDTVFCNEFIRDVRLHLVTTEGDTHE